MPVIAEIPDPARLADAPPDRVTLEGPAASGPPPEGTRVVLERGQVRLITDHFGLRPVFYRVEDDRVRIADEPWSLLDPGHALDGQAAAELLLVGHGLGGRTLFTGVGITEASSEVVLRPGRLPEVRHRPWSPPQQARMEPLDTAARRLAERLGGLLAGIDEGPVLVPLSGGLDSRVLLAAAVDAGLRPRAWTFAATHGTGEEELARRVAEALGVPHTVTTYAPVDLGPQAHDFVTATCGQLGLEHLRGFGLHTALPELPPVVLSGIYGDLVCGGGRLLDPAIPPADVVKHRTSQLLGGLDAASIRRALPGLPNFEDDIEAHVEQTYALSGADPRVSDWTLLRNRPSRFNVWPLIAAEPLVTWRAPFLSEELVTVCYGMEERHHHGSAAYCRAIALRWPDLAAIPWQRTGLRFDRPPTSLERWRSAAEGRLRRRRAAPFDDPATEADAFSSLVAEVLPEIETELTPLGIDVRALLADTAVRASRHTDFALRMAAVALARRQAAGGPPSGTRG